MARVTLETLSPDEAADIARVAAGQLTKSAFKARHQRGNDTVTRLVNEYRGDNAAANGANGVISVELVESLEFGNGAWKALEQLQSEYSKLETERFEVSVRLKDKAPVMVVFMSDLHVGHMQTNMQKIREDCEAIKNTDGVYVILGGDLFDNVTSAIAVRGMHHEQNAPVAVQQYLVEELVDYLGRDKIIAMLLGNHEEWTVKNADYNPIRHLSELAGCPYLGPFGYVNVQLGKHDYRILAAHQFRMNSSFNKTHAPKRLMDFVGDADIVFTGHKHDPASEQVYVRREKRFFAQAGSYMKGSIYGKRLGFTESSPDMPGVLLYPNERTFVGVFNSLKEGRWMLEGARANHAATG